MRQILVVDGMKFYPESKSPYWVNRGGKRLHIYVWEKKNGKVPKGFHVHHKRGRENNDISNLKLLSQFDHLSLHGKERSEESRRRMIEVVLPKAVEWHKSEKAKPFHRRHYKYTLGALHQKRIDKICIVCKKDFKTDACKTDAKFCSNNCKSKFRRDRKIDNEKRRCIVCNKEFNTNRYSKAKCCSLRCGWEKRRGKNKVNIVSGI